VTGSSDFFVFRTPLLPFEELEEWGADLSAPAAGSEEETLAPCVAADRDLLRTKLRELVGRPEILEALFMASPSLVEALEGWQRHPDSKKGLRAERALVRYFIRLTTRPTPFGLFSGNSLSSEEPWSDGRARLELAPRARYRRHTRLDMDYLYSLTEALGRRREVWESLPLRLNSSLYRVAERLHYAEARLDGKLRSYHLVAVDLDPFVEAAITAARTGASAADAAEAVVAADPDGEVTREEAMEFVGMLVENQLLGVELKPLVTGPGALDSLIADLESSRATAGFSRPLRAAQEKLASLDEAFLGNRPERYLEISRDLDEALPPDSDISRLFQVDMTKSVAEARLPATVMEELLVGVELLHRMQAPPSGESSLDRFRSEFVERYGEGQAVPMTEVLDEEIGIGFERAEGPRAAGAPLLADLPFAAVGVAGGAWSAGDSHRLKRLQALIAAGEGCWELSDGDVAAMEVERRKPLPDAFHVMAEIAAASEEDVEAGDFRLLLKGASGPSGARLLGRFCHLDRRLEALVRRHLQQEEAMRPGAVFAEIVHLPQGRVGNILARPQLRAHEIEFLGRSSVDSEQRIRIDDLRVAVRGDRVVLLSERLAREVVPRLTTAHNFYTRGLGIYRFLCSLQGQASVEGVVWRWGRLSEAPYLPRVTRGRLVLSRARWMMSGEEVESLTRTEGAELMAAARRWREERGIPRCCAFKEGDHELLVDFENILSLESFSDAVKGRSAAVLVELFPGADDLWARGPEGRYVHELLVPVVRSAKEEEPLPKTDQSSRSRPAATVREVYAPGSEWLYAKVYSGPSTADAILREVVAPVVGRALRQGVIDSWFFLRFRDPGRHLRLRFHGEPTSLQRDLMTDLERGLRPWMEDGRVWRLQLDTYQRETHRYGGPEAIDLVERLFYADSRAVLEILQMLTGDSGEDLRWRICLRAADQLLDDLELDPAAKWRVASELRDTFTREFEASLELKRRIGDRHRRERKSIETLLDRQRQEVGELAPAWAALERRSEVFSEVVPVLLQRMGEGRLSQSVERIAPSLVHMHVNRMMRSHPRPHELVLYEFLFRTYAARSARRGRPPERA
jgi:lantibiotic biosynthesis protein